MRTAPLLTGPATVPRSSEVLKVLVTWSIATECAKLCEVLEQRFHVAFWPKVGRRCCKQCKEGITLHTALLTCERRSRGREGKGVRCE